MQYPIEFNSKRAFMAWVKEQNQKGESRQFYCRLAQVEGAQLYVHTSDRSEDIYGPFVPFSLPKTMAAAGEFWSRTLEDDITVCMVSESEMDTVWCEVKLSVWNSLPQLYVYMDLGTFREVTYEEFREIVGDEEILRQMSDESWMMGISVRDATHLRTADGEFLLEKRKAEQKKAKKKPTRKTKAKKPTSKRTSRTKKKR